MAVDQFTYSKDPSKSAKDEVRFLTTDTVKARALFDDREILFQLTKTPNTRMAAAELLEIKSRELAQKGTIRVGDVSKDFAKAAETMKKCADALRRDALKRARPFFGGLTKSGNLALDQDTDATQPQFGIGQNDNPSAVQLDNDLSALFGDTSGL